MSPSPKFGPTSRYAVVETATWTGPDGRDIVYLRRRFVASPELFSLVTEHYVVGGDRLDNLAATYLGDPEQFWRICDANHALWPSDLLKEGAVLRIPPPEE